MFVLPVAAASSRQLPSILGEKPNQFSDFHTPLDIRPAAA
jgi:hypothetical protein